MFTPKVWMVIAYVFICSTFMAYLLNAFGLKHVSPSIVSIYIYLQPLLVTSIALLLVKDVLITTKLAEVFSFSQSCICWANDSAMALYSGQF